MDDTPVKTLVEMDDFCRSKQIVFLYGYNHGAIAGIFTDFGPVHNVFDPDGEPVKTLILDNILNGQEEGSVTIDGDRYEELSQFFRTGSAQTFDIPTDIDRIICTFPDTTGICCIREITFDSKKSRECQTTPRKGKISLSAPKT